MYLVMHPIISLNVTAWNVKESEYTKSVVDCHNDDVIIRYEYRWIMG
jgi:hypothetical protein